MVCPCHLELYTSSKASRVGSTTTQMCPAVTKVYLTWEETDRVTQGQQPCTVLFSLPGHRARQTTRLSDTLSSLPSGLVYLEGYMCSLRGRRREESMGPRKASIVMVTVTTFHGSTER